MKQGWEIKKLGEVCDFQNGFAFKSKTYKENGLPILRITNIQNQTLDTNELVYFDTKDYKENFDRFRVIQDDLVIAMSGATTGKIGINTTNRVYYLNQRVGKFIPKKNLQKSFLYYFLTTKVEESLRIAAGAAQPNLSTAQINNFEIPLPPLPEQQRIVSILDKTFAAIDKAKANAEQNLKNAKELFESYLQGVFEKKGDGWEDRKLGDVCVVERGSSPRPIKKYQTNSPDGVNWIKIGDTKGVEKYIYNTKEKITKEGAEKSRYVKEGDFILSNSMSFGKPYIMKTDGYIHDGWFVFRLPNYLDKDYFYYLLTSPNVQKQIQSLGAGAIVKNISGDLVKKVDVFYPKTIKGQQTIVRHLDALRGETQKLEAVYQKKMADLEELKKSVLQKAFAGELRGGEPVEPKTEKAVVV